MLAHKNVIVTSQVSFPFLQGALICIKGIGLSEGDLSHDFNTHRAKYANLN